MNQSVLLSVIIVDELQTVLTLMRCHNMWHLNMGLHCLLRLVCPDKVKTVFCFIGLSVYLLSWLQIRGGGGIHIIFFLFPHENICCWYSLEVPR